MVNGTVPPTLATHSHYCRSQAVDHGGWRGGQRRRLPAVTTAVGGVLSGRGVRHPRRRVAEEVHIPASNRWAPGVRWDGAVWRPLQVATRGNEMTLVAGSYDPVEGTAIGTARRCCQPGSTRYNDPWDQEDHACGDAVLQGLT